MTICDAMSSGTATFLSGVLQVENEMHRAELRHSARRYARCKGLVYDAWILQCSFRHWRPDPPWSHRIDTPPRCYLHDLVLQGHRQAVHHRFDIIDISEISA